MIYKTLRQTIGYRRPLRHTFTCDVRHSSGSAERKRFYKSVSVVHNEDKYGIHLDGRPLKTPNGHLFYTHNHSLALMVANEWQTQRHTIRLSAMHLTQLSNTAIDNPGHDCRQSLADSILEFIDSDTLCFRVTEPKE
ncbi:unnamed protein product, partial [Oppiella nova]